MYPRIDSYLYSTREELRCFRFQSSNPKLPACSINPNRKFEPCYDLGRSCYGTYRIANPQWGTLTKLDDRRNGFGNLGFESFVGVNRRRPRRPSSALLQQPICCGSFFLSNIATECCQLVRLPCGFIGVCNQGRLGAFTSQPQCVRCSQCQEAW
jgi:hypothetical protein